jgi:drug/metabolite transporter (DMT)-like permease
VRHGIALGLLSAVLFGVSTPLAKVLVGSIAPLWMAALLYLGAGGGLLIVFAARRATRGEEPIAMPAPHEWRWIAGAIALGGVVGPVALMYGLTMTSGATGSLLLNLEAVLTAVLAWFLFHENFDRRIALGMVAIVAGAIVLATTPGGPSMASIQGALLVALACLCWALDNNLTRKASAGDAVLLATLKGLVAGSVNGALAMLLGLAAPPFLTAIAAVLVGFLGYGVSLVLFILALRHLGTARAGAYFSVAPFFGALLAVALGQDAVSWQLALAAGLMAVGVWLHVTEHHAHQHEHDALDHTHSHRHDEHHRHEHGFPWKGNEPHVHPHQHPAVRHSHPHYPDLHHRHRH